MTRPGSHPLRRARPLASLGLLVLLAALPASAQQAQDSETADQNAVSVDEDLFGDEEIVDEDDLFGDEAPRLEAAEATEQTDAPDAPGTDVAPEPAAPITQPGRRPGIEEILIQGRAGQGLETDAPVSLTAFSEEDLQALGVEDVSDLASATPNLEIRTAGSTTPTFFIRGVGLNDFTSNASGAVAIYQDDVPLNLPALQLGQVFDVEDVEVLRGPQTSRAGRNATAGAIKVYSRKPTGDFGGRLRWDYGRFNYSDGEGALEIPLLADLLSARAAFRATTRDGLAKNRCGELPPIGLERIVDPTRSNQNQCGEAFEEPISIPNPDPPPNNFVFSRIRAGLESELNDLNRWATRAQLRFLPPDSDVEWLLNVHGGRVDQRGTVGQSIGTGSGFFGSANDARYRDPDVVKEFDRISTKLNVSRPPNTVCGRPGTPGRDECLAAYGQRELIAQGRLARNLAGDRPLDTGPFKGSYNRDGHERQETYGGFLRADAVLDFASIKAISGFEAYERSRFTDTDYSPNLIFEFKTEDHAWQFTQDLAAEGELEAVPVTWSLGALYLMQEHNFEQEILGGASIRGVKKRYLENTWNLGVFGEVGWELLDDLILNGSVRYNWERKEFDVTIIRANNVCVDLIDNMGRLRPGLPCEKNVTRDAPIGALELRYFFNDEVSSYLKYTRGWKGPQLNASDGDTNTTITLAEPETIDALEVGFKGAWLDGMLVLSGAFFWYNWEDYQVFLFTNDFSAAPQREVRNASTAQLYGGELEADIRPLEGLNITARFGWLESKFLDFTDAGIRSIVLPGTPPINLVTEVPIDYTGNRLPNTPRFKVSGSVSYDLDLGRFGVIIPRYDFSWTDDVFFDPSEGRGAPNNQGEIFMPQYAIGQKAYWLHSVRLTYQLPGGGVEVALWMRNVGDEVYKTLAVDSSASAGLVRHLVGDPQTYGISVSTSF